VQEWLLASQEGLCSMELVPQDLYFSHLDTVTKFSRKLVSVCLPHKILFEQKINLQLKLETHSEMVTWMGYQSSAALNMTYRTGIVKHNLFLVSVVTVKCHKLEWHKCMWLLSQNCPLLCIYVKN